MTRAGRFPMTEGDMPPPPFELSARVGNAAAGYVRVASELVGARLMCSSRPDRRWRAASALKSRFRRENSIGRHGGQESMLLQRIRSTLWRETGCEKIISSIR